MVFDLMENKVYNKDGKQIDLKSHLAGKTVGIYFSAHWCPPCRGFTPVLAEFYNKNSNDLNFEVIFVSSDRDQGSFNDYYKEMPWLCLEFNERELKETLTSKFGIRGIPTLIILNDQGVVINPMGRSVVSNPSTPFKWI